MMDFRRLVVMLSLVGTSAGAQPVDLIRQQLDDVRGGFFELGPFYVTPVIRIQSGYDSNALSTPDPQEDINAIIGPGIRLGVPVGSKAFVDLFQEVDFVYYREQVGLRQIFNVTRVGGGWGGRRYLIEISDELRDETERPTSEFDFPVEQRSNVLDASLTLALGWRQELRARYQRRNFEIREDSVSDATIPQRLNNIRDVVIVDLSRSLSSRTNVVAEAFYEGLDFDDVSRDSTSQGARFGLDFSPQLTSSTIPSRVEKGVAGSLMVGFRRLVPVVSDRVDYTGLIGNADVSVTTTALHRLRGLFERDIVPSIFDDNWYFVQNRWGASFRWQLHERFSVEPGTVFGTNDYPLPRFVEEADGELRPAEIVEIVDRHRAYRLTIDYNLRAAWYLGVTTEYLERQSNVVAFDKDRLIVSFHLMLNP